MHLFVREQAIGPVFVYKLGNVLKLIFVHILVVLGFWLFLFIQVLIHFQFFNCAPKWAWLHLSVHRQHLQRVHLGAYLLVLLNAVLHIALAVVVRRDQGGLVLRLARGAH